MTEKTATLSRRCLLARSMPAMAAAAVTRPAAAIALSGLQAADDDPIFAVIEAHKKANALYSTALDIYGGDSEEVDEASQHEEDAFWRVFETEPTTGAGLVALLEYVGMSRFGDKYSNLSFAYQSWNRHDESRWLTMLASTLRTLLARVNPARRTP